MGPSPWSAAESSAPAWRLHQPARLEIPAAGRTSRRQSARPAKPSSTISPSFAERLQKWAVASVQQLPLHQEMGCRMARQAVLQPPDSTHKHPSARSQLSHVSQPPRTCGSRRLADGGGDSSPDSSPKPRLAAVGGTATAGGVDAMWAVSAAWATPPSHSPFAAAAAEASGDPVCSGRGSGRPPCSQNHPFHQHKGSTGQGCPSSEHSLMLTQVLLRPEKSG